MIYEAIAKMRYGSAFLVKVIEVSNYLKIPSDWLMAVMFKESGINAKAYNANGGASGLIQFMPSTMAQWNITGEQMRRLSGVDQLEYVKKYFSSYKGKILSYGDLYLITFFPIAIGKPDDYVLQTKKLSAELIAKANKVIDLNKDLKITKKEFYAYTLKGFSPTIQELLTKAKDLIGMLILMLLCSGSIIFITAKGAGIL